MNIITRFFQFMESGQIRAIDFYFARFISEYETQAIQNTLFLSAYLVSQQSSQGNVCITLNEFARTPILNDKSELDSTILCPAIEDWFAHLAIAKTIGRPGDNTPLILDDNRLYLARYWHYEQTLAQDILNRAKINCEFDSAKIKKGLDRYFPDHHTHTDWQAFAAVVAVLKHFCVISGGPGTGKTTTVAKILALLIEQASPHKLRISIAAPTGKAATRLTEALKSVKAQLQCDKEISQAIPDECITIHRLLGVRKNQSGFIYHQENPLHLDILVIDEASMVDLSLMAKLCDALPQSTRLILLGDKDQLSSVEAGSVLGDICNCVEKNKYTADFAQQISALLNYAIETIEPAKTDIQDNIVILQKSYRFDQHSGIGAMANGVNDGKTNLIIEHLTHQQYSEIHWINENLNQLIELAAQQYSTYLKQTQPAAALQFFNQFRILCALRKGPFGIDQINSYLETALQKRKLIQKKGTYYHGRPIMITQNDYRLQLFNGDIGMIWVDPDRNNQLSVFFIMTDGTSRRFLPHRLPSHETAYAMTIHKSQGSEFNQIAIIIPNEDSPVLTRELLYTAITRARKKVTVVATATMLKKCIQKKISRTSGLKKAFQKPTSDPPRIAINAAPKAASL